MSTVKTPLVMGANGFPRQLQPGETLNATTSDTTAVVQTNGESSVPLVIGNVVYPSSADSVKRAEANALASAMPMGMVLDASIAAGATGNIAVAGVVSFSSTALVDAIAGTTGGFTAGTVYFLSPTNPGQITASPPATVGQYVVTIGVAISTTELKLMITPPIGL